MSASFSVASSTGAYEVEVAQGLFPASVREGGESVVVADEFFRGRIDGDALFIEANEPEKSLDRMPALIEKMRAMGVNRRTHLVAVGGGVIQDLSAFVASVYMRGLGWTYVPTTVLAMVDSCIGGKSSINVGPYKNLVGTFHPPQRIHVDPALAETLPRDQFASGLIEAAKICFCRGPESFAQHLSCEPSTTMSREALEAVILNSLLAKKHFYRGRRVRPEGAAAAQLRPYFRPRDRGRVALWRATRHRCGPWHLVFAGLPAGSWPGLFRGRCRWRTGRASGWNDSHLA